MWYIPIRTLENAEVKSEISTSIAVNGKLNHRIATLL